MGDGRWAEFKNVETRVCRFVESRDMTEEELVEAGFADSPDDELDFELEALRKSKRKMKQLTLNVPHPTSSTSNNVALRTSSFAWTYPWLCVRVGANASPNISVASPHNFVREVESHRFWPIEYMLEDRMGLHGVALFLSTLVYYKREMPETEMPRFEEFRKFLNEVNPSSVKLSNLHKLLIAFKRRDELSMAEGNEIEARINTTDAGGVWMMAVRAEHVFPVAAILFPRRIRSIVRNEDDGKETGKGGSFKDQLQDTLEDLAENDPWKLGFEELTYQRSKRSCPVSNLEAPMYLMRRAPFYSNLTTEQKAALTLYEAIKNFCLRHGHTYVTQNNIDYLVRGELENVIDAVNFLLDYEVVQRDVSAKNIERFHLMRYWRAEESIVNGLEKLMDLGGNWKLGIDFQSDEFARVRSDPDQLLAAKKIATNPITLMSGRGGTGKTEVVTSVLNVTEEMIKRAGEAIEEDCVLNADATVNTNSRGADCRRESPQKEKKPQVLSNGPVLYTAPTGKAAGVIRKRIKRNAFTIHQIVSSYKMHKGDEWKFGQTQILAVDECSMVSLELFSHLIRVLIKACPLKKVVLLGDVSQLPSIAPGNFMSDLFRSLRAESFVVELTTNHRSESSLIFENAHRICGGKMPIFDRNHGFHLVQQSYVKVPPEAQGGVELLSPLEKQTHKMTLFNNSLCENISKDKHLSYLQLLWNERNRFGLGDHSKSQFIAFKNAECAVVNEICCQVYNKHGVKRRDEKTGRQVLHFERGDKVMCGKNHDATLFVTKREERQLLGKVGETGDAAMDDPEESESNAELKEATDRLMNGSVYIIKDVRLRAVAMSDDGDHTSDAGSQNDTISREFYVFDDLSGSVIRPEKASFLRHGKPSHAWGLTIHKFQGSEADTVVYGVSDSTNETWQHVYTAVTRAKKRVIVVGRWEDLAAAVRRSPKRRQTTLDEKVKDSFQRLKNTSIHEDIFVSDEEEFAAIASQMDVSGSGNTDGGVINWGGWTSPESSDETSFEHYASQLTDSQLNGITGMDYDIIIKEEDSSQSPMRKGMETLEL